MSETDTRHATHLARAEAAADDGRLELALADYKAGIAILLAARKAAPAASARHKELTAAASRALGKAEAVKARIQRRDSGGAAAAVAEAPPGISNDAAPLSDVDDPADGHEGGCAVPSQRFSDVVGVAHAAMALKEAVILPAKFPQLFRGSHYRRWMGVLLVGAPGCGKTLLARAAAGEAGVPLVRLDCHAVAASGRYHHHRGTSASPSGGLRASEALIHQPFQAAAEAGRRWKPADDAAAAARDAQAVLLLEEPEALSAPAEILCAECRAAVDLQRDTAKALHAKGDDEAAVNLAPVKRCAPCDAHEAHRTHLRAAKTALLYELDRCTNLCVIATSPQPWGICYAVRKRFAKRCYLPPPTTPERVELLKLELGWKRTAADSPTPAAAAALPQPRRAAASVAEIQLLWDVAERLDGYTPSDIVAVAREASFGPLREVTRATHFRRVLDGTTGTRKWTPCAATPAAAAAPGLAAAAPYGDGDADGRKEEDAAVVGEVRAMAWPDIAADELLVQQPVMQRHLLRALHVRPSRDAELEARLIEWTLQFSDQIPS